MTVLHQRLSRSSVQHSGTTLVLCLFVIFLTVFLLDMLRPRTKLLIVAFRYISTLDAINSDLSLAPALNGDDGLLIVLLVCVNHINTFALLANLMHRRGGHGCECPDSGVVVG